MVKKDVINLALNYLGYQDSDLENNNPLLYNSLSNIYDFAKTGFLTYFKWYPLVKEIILEGSSAVLNDDQTLDYDLPDDFGFAIKLHENSSYDNDINYEVINNKIRINSTSANDLKLRYTSKINDEDINLVVGKGLALIIALDSIHLVAGPVQITGEMYKILQANLEEYIKQLNNYNEILGKFKGTRVYP